MLHNSREIVISLFIDQYYMLLSEPRSWENIPTLHLFIEFLSEMQSISLNFIKLKYETYYHYCLMVC